MTLKNIIQIADFAVAADNPIITIPLLFIMVFIGYALGKKFFDTGYVATSKEAREAQHQLISELQCEIERLNKRVETLIKENKDLADKLLASGMIDGD